MPGLNPIEFLLCNDISSSDSELSLGDKGCVEMDCEMAPAGCELRAQGLTISKCMTYSRCVEEQLVVR